MRLGARVERVGDATVLTVVGVDHPMLNRAFLSSSDPREAIEIADLYRARGLRRFFLHRQQPADDSDLDALAAAGLHPYRRRWIKLLARLDRATSVPPKGDCEFPVVRAEPTHALAAGSVFCRGFELPQAAAEIFATAVGRPSWRVSVAVSGTQVVGVGYLFVDGDLGYLAGAATEAAYRGRGIQSALMAARLAQARNEGCLLIASETGEALAGDPQHSMRNMQHLGLRPIGTTQNLCPAALTWDHGVRAEVRQ